PKTSLSVMASMKEGLVAVRTGAGMTGLIALAFWITLLSYPLTTFLPVFARDIFHGSSMTFTMMLATYGAGSVAGALIVASSRNQKGTAKSSLVVMVLLGVLITAFALSRNLFFSIFVLFGAGIALIIVFAVNSSLVQIYAADALRGRVISVYNVAFRGGMPIGSLICGFLIKQTSAPVIIAANGVLLCFFAAYYLFVEKKVARL